MCNDFDIENLERHRQTPAQAKPGDVRLKQLAIDISVCQAPQKGIQVQKHFFPRLSECDFMTVFGDYSIYNHYPACTEYWPVLIIIDLY